MRMTQIILLWAINSSLILSTFLPLECIRLNPTYPPEVVELGVEWQFDEARWAIYRFYSQCKTNYLVKRMDGSIDTLQSNISYLTLPLTMTNVELYKDTLRFNFFFVAKDGFYTDDLLCQNLNGIGFVGKMDSISFFDFEDHGMRLNKKEFSLEFDEELINQTFRQSLEKERYINRWLLAEAMKRGEI